MRRRHTRHLPDHASTPATIEGRPTRRRRPGGRPPGAVAAIDAELALIVEHRSALSAERRALG